MTGKNVYLEENETINRFVQLTYQTLNSSALVPLGRLESSYLAMDNVIHGGAKDERLDAGAFSYVCSRLPPCIFSVNRILFGQSESILEECGVPMDAWTEVLAKARRRRYLYNGTDTLIAFIASKSDLDDIIPSLLAFQIEWNKCHELLRNVKIDEGTQEPGDLAGTLGIPPQDLEKLQRLFGDDFPGIMNIIRDRPCRISVQNYEASYCRYRRETETWWSKIHSAFPELEERPVYFVSSNSHSLINVISGFAGAHQDEILAFAESRSGLASLVHEFRTLGDDSIPSWRKKQNILFYLLMKYEQDPGAGPSIVRKRIAFEAEAGVLRISNPKTLDVPTQVIDLRKTAALWNGKHIPGLLPFLGETNAIILNIDYPLGRTAYFVLDKIAEHVSKLLGVYVIGKAASLVADRGDVIIPSVILDQHTRNQYFFENCIRAKDVLSLMDTSVHGIYDNQRAVTVLGTLLQNNSMLYSLQAAGITDIEMEAGPYLAAVYEMTRPKRYPENETISIASLDMDLGIIHYVSDNPLSQQRLDNSLALDGVDSTYASTLAVLQKILIREWRNYGKDSER